jgi:hypothetical protein
MEELCLRSAALMITRPMTCKIDHAFFNSRFERFSLYSGGRCYQI